MLQSHRIARAHRSHLPPLGLVTALALLHCGPKDHWARFDEQGATAYVLATRAPEASDWSWVAGQMTDAPVVRLEEGGEGLLLLYDQPLGTLGLEGQGPVSCLTIAPTRILRLVLETATTDVAVSEVPPALERALVGDTTRCHPCAPLEMTAIRTDKAGIFGGAAWIDEESALVAGEIGLYRSTRDRIERVDACDGLAEPPNTLAAAGDRRFWLGTLTRELARVRLEPDDRSCVVETSTTLPAWTVDDRRLLIANVAPHPSDPGAHDLIAVRTSGEVFRWTSTGLRRLGRMEDHPRAIDHKQVSVLRLDAEVTLTANAWTRVYVWRGDQLERTEDLPLMPVEVSSRPRDRITSLAFDPVRNEVLAGTGLGSVWRRDSATGEWSELFRLPIEEDVGSIISSQHRNLVMLVGGDIGLVHPELGLCPNLARVEQGQRSTPNRVAVTRGAHTLMPDALGSLTTEAGLIWITDPPPAEPPN